MSDLPIYIVLTTLVSVMGFILSALIIWTLLHRHRSPTSTFAWLMAILLLPYVGIPLFLLLGGRKLDRIVEHKTIAIEDDETGETANANDGILLPPAVGGVFPTVCCPAPILVTDAVDAFHRLRDLIANAQNSIDICTYILGDDATGHAVIAALTERACSGVNVRLLLDSYGSMSLPTKRLTEFRSAGGQVLYFMPIMKIPYQRRMNLRNHRKTLIIDDRTAMVGGMNLSLDYMGSEHQHEYWDDLCVIVEGEAAQHIKCVFESDWGFAMGQDSSDFEVSDERTGNCNEAEMQLVVSGPDVKGDPIHDSILIALFNATKRVWIVSPYILPDEMLLKAIALAAQRGIDVRLITPAESNHPLADFAREGYMDELARTGVRIYFHKGAMLHGKSMIIDDDLAFIGSANLDMRSMFFNFEIAGTIRSTEFTQQLDTWTRELMANSHEGVRKKNRLERAWFGLGRLVAPVL